MTKEKDAGGVAPGSREGARSATGGEPGAAAIVGRWSAGRKKAVVLRLLRGEPVDAISREVSVPIYKLERWRDRALDGIDSGLKERESDPLTKCTGSDCLDTVLQLRRSFAWHKPDGLRGET